jgi:hypothetical protein
MGHVVLLGDSIFDNAAYVGGDPDVVHQLRERLESGWQATLLAVDGSVAADVARQLVRVPSDATHLIVSAGGNDALGHLDLLEERTRSVGAAIERLASIRESFHAAYGRMLEVILRLRRATVLCTIYDPCFPDRRLQRLAVAALTLFNDVVTRQAGSAGVPVIDLRRLFDDAACYANPIEPSVLGGARLADVISRIVTEHDFSVRRAVLYP